MPNEPRNLQTESVVLRHSNWGEADRLLVLYTREIGKIRAIAKGVRKMRSRKAGHLEPFTRVKLLLAHGRDFWIVTQAETVDAYLPLREDLLRTAYGAYVLELLDRFTYDEGQNRGLYQLLTDTLSRLATLPDVYIAVHYYEIRLLDVVGFRPELFQCVNCQRVIQAEDQFFSMAQGGVVCPNCEEHVSGMRRISMQALKFLRHLQRSSFAEASRADPSPAVRIEMEGLLHDYMTYLLERKLNSPGFLDEIRRGQRLQEK